MKKKIVLVAAALISTQCSYAGNEYIDGTWAKSVMQTDSSLIIMLLLTGVVAILTFATILLTLNVILSVINAENAKKGLPAIDLFGDFKKRFITGNVLPVERSGEIQLSHSYDDIVELDNTMPPWLRAVFGVTIAFAMAYLSYYYVLGLGSFQEQEYEQEIAAAEIEKTEYQKKADNAINEDNVTQIKELALLAGAKEIYGNNCKTCHGANAEGGAGPNLTDAYWLHGGDVKAIFKTIKYGVPAKGMIAWQQKLRPKDIQLLASFILSLQGSNPAGAKAPQGELIVASTTVSADSAQIKTDTTASKVSN